MTGALAVILGRACSEGLPGKNVMPIAGRRCAQWTIDDAVASRAVERVVVSSDCPVLRRLAADAGVRVVTRPDELASPNATVDAAARHAVAAVDAAGRHATIVVLYANVPVRPTTLIDDAVAMLDTTSAHSVQSYEPVGKHHPWWTATLDAQTGAAAGFDGGALNRGVHRRQDLPPAYVPSGGVIALTRAALMLDIVDAPPGPHAFFGTDRRGVVHAAGDVVDIDDAFDAVIAEAMLMRRCQATPASPRDECGHHKSTTDEEAA